jgi:hypothetical protein
LGSMLTLTASSASRNIAAGRNADLKIDAFPAAGFQAIFRESQARGSLPDLLLIDNIGILTRIPPQYGGYEGVAEEPTARKDFVPILGRLRVHCGLVVSTVDQLD